MSDPKRKKQQAAGNTVVYNPAGEAGIDRVLAKRPPSTTKLGYGRVVTTVGSQREINKRIKQGYEILWCQMSKTISSEQTGEVDDG